MNDTFDLICDILLILVLLIILIAYHSEGKAAEQKYKLGYKKHTQDQTEEYNVEDTRSVYADDLDQGN